MFKTLLLNYSKYTSFYKIKSSNKVKFTFIIYFLVIFGIENICAQTFKIEGKISTSTGPVKFATITFVDNNDSTKKYSTVTDTAGNYLLDVITAVKGNDNIVPTKFELEQNYPNPFSTTTTIQYKLKNQSNISVKIYNILGQLVKEFNVGIQLTGLHGITWDGKNNFGQKVASGVYFYQLQTNNETLVKKMVFTSGNIQLNLHPVISFNTGLKTNKTEKTTTKAFTVEISNNSNTKPQIFYQRFSDINISQDTNLDFQVQEANTAYELCYEKEDTTLYNGSLYPNWEVYINNIIGTSPLNISNYYGDDEYPKWSPDGKYIAYSKRTDSNLEVIVYDIQNQTYTNLVPINPSSQTPKWTPNGKVYFTFREDYGKPYITYIMNPDGSDKKIMLDTVADEIYFYADSYNFVYRSGTKIYKSNIDTSFKEEIFDLAPDSYTYFTIRDFNSLTGELLLNTNAFPDYKSAIATYNIETKQLKFILGAEPGFWVYLQRYSKDYSKIVFIEVDTTTYELQYLSVFSNGEKKRLVKLTGLKEEFDWNPMEFSYDGKYVAFGKVVYGSGAWLSWTTYLYVVDIETATLQFIDRGHSPSWKPYP
jgi:Tol biopolymer transport system component